MSDTHEFSLTLSNYAEACMARDFMRMAMMQRHFSQQACDLSVFYHDILHRLHVNQDPALIANFGFSVGDGWVEVDAAWFRRVVFAFEDLDSSLEYDSIKVAKLTHAQQARMAQMWDAMPDAFVACFLHVVQHNGDNSSMGLSKMFYALPAERLHRVLNTYFSTEPVFSAVMWAHQALSLAQYNDPHSQEQLKQWIQVTQRPQENILTTFCDFIKEQTLEDLRDLSCLYLFRLINTAMGSTHNHIASVLACEHVGAETMHILALAMHLPCIVRDEPSMPHFTFSASTCLDYDYWNLHPENPYVQASNYLAYEHMSGSEQAVIDMLYPEKSDDIYVRIQRLMVLIDIVRKKHRPEHSLDASDLVV